MRSSIYHTGHRLASEGRILSSCFTKISVLDGPDGVRGHTDDSCDTLSTSVRLAYCQIARRKIQSAAPGHCAFGLVCQCPLARYVERAEYNEFLVEKHSEARRINMAPYLRQYLSFVPTSFLESVMLHSRR